jgi:hypothetical protein
MSGKECLLAPVLGLRLSVPCFVGVAVLGVVFVGVAAGGAVPVRAAAVASAAAADTTWRAGGPSERMVERPVDAVAVRAADIRAADVVTSYVYLPFVVTFHPCAPIPGESYGELEVPAPPADRPAEEHGDLNLALRSYELTNAYKGLVDYGGGTDPNAPQLPGLFADDRTPAFSDVYQVHHWDWGCNCRGSLITDPEVTLAGMAVAPGETIHVPGSGYDIGDGYQVLVLYASAERITLKYTLNDNVVSGYTLHVENVCVEPSLLALYQSWNDQGRGYLPALRAGQAFGRARGDEIGVAIRDTGAFQDPRSRKDWWKGR